MWALFNQTRVQYCYWLRLLRWKRDDSVFAILDLGLQCLVNFKKGNMSANKTSSITSRSFGWYVYGMSSEYINFLNWDDGRSYVYRLKINRVNTLPCDNPLFNFQATGILLFKNTWKIRWLSILLSKSLIVRSGFTLNNLYNKPFFHIIHFTYAERTRDVTRPWCNSSYCPILLDNLSGERTQWRPHIISTLIWILCAAHPFSILFSNIHIYNMRNIEFAIGNQL